MKKKYLTLILGLVCGALFAQSNLMFTSSCDSLSINTCSAEQVTLIATATTDCTIGSSLVFNYQVDENNDGSIDITGTSYEVTETFSLGEHRITFTVTDECNSSVTCEYIFTLGDFEPPVAVCLNGLVSVIMPSSGSITLWAEDFSESGFDNCTASSDLQYSFSSDSLVVSIEIDCGYFCSIPNGNSVPVSIYIFDEAGNQDSCITYVLYHDPNGGCYFGCGDPSFFSILIEVETIEGCTYELDDHLICFDGANCIQSGNPLPSIYSIFEGTLISLENNQDPLNGVTTFDLVLISKHILGILPFDSPFKELAADVNESETITTFDIVLLRRLILQMDFELAIGKSWIFSPEATPFQFTHQEYFFTAIKLGDVNGSAISCLQGNTPSETRTLDDPLHLFTENQFLQKGKIYTIPIFAENYKALLGGQFTMNFAKEKIRIEEVLSKNLEAMNNESFGMSRVDEGVLLGSWAKDFAEDLGDDLPVFELKITALENTSIQEVLEINSSILNAEVYREIENEIELLEIQFDVLEKVSGEIEAIPNPFTDFTNISFTNEQEGLVELNVYDLSGKMIFFKKENRVKGQQNFSIGKNDLPAKGIYFYEIKMQGSTYSSKFILQ